ncbi:hypothetical protein Y032_0001g174 [Ancylostoma ceylanicum]|uniref:Uncharacterized protein n=1 Tax=Ancylostoma ceylanicum TaxID=53326 RepID=A0A016W2Q8_9BILA|nr:hypothetical protein Y032_0001g174 [Ancylostoma ceylanicum]
MTGADLPTPLWKKCNKNRPVLQYNSDEKSTCARDLKASPTAPLAAYVGSLASSVCAAHSAQDEQFVLFIILEAPEWISDIMNERVGHSPLQISIPSIQMSPAPV